MLLFVSLWSFEVCYASRMERTDIYFHNIGELTLPEQLMSHSCQNHNATKFSGLKRALYSKYGHTALPLPEIKPRAHLSR